MPHEDLEADMRKRIDATITVTCGTVCGLTIIHSRIEPLKDYRQLREKINSISS